MDWFETWWRLSQRIWKHVPKVNLSLWSVLTITLRTTSSCLVSANKHMDKLKTHHPNTLSQGLSLVAFMYVPLFVLQISFIATLRDDTTEANTEAPLPVCYYTHSGCRWRHHRKIVSHHTTTIVAVISVQGADEDIGPALSAISGASAEAGCLLAVHPLHY